jgi:hypothetical protein
MEGLLSSDLGWKSQGENVAPQPGPPADLVDFLAVHHEMRDKATHIRLQKDLVQHMWNHLGNNYSSSVYLIFIPIIIICVKLCRMYFVFVL